MSSKNQELDEKLLKMHREAEERDAKRKASKLGYPYIDPRTAPINIEALGMVDQEEAEAAKLAVIEVKQKKIAVAVFDSSLPETQKIIKVLTAQGFEISFLISSLSGLKAIWDFYRFVPKIKEKITGQIKLEKVRLNELRKSLTSLENIKKALQEVGADSVYTAQILEVVLAGALSNRVSDVHFEPKEKRVKLRLRVDGLLYDAWDELSSAAYVPILSRIKLLSGLKINIHDEPQDGRFSITLPEKTIEIRTSIMPSEYGEAIVLRVLDPETIRLSIKDLGFREDDLAIIQKELVKPNGAILNTGPTGSGKTTTLYTFLSHIQSSETKIVTIEDPIEYHLEGIEQTQVDPEAGYTFAVGLRSVLRQDPDVILIGEIRDLETAEIAMHSALTGHLVFSTLHTNDASGAIPRLLDLGVKAQIVAPGVNIIIAQRLVRRLCKLCREPVETTPEMKEKVEKFLEKLPKRIDKKSFKNFQMFKPKGCPECNFLGYKGRISVFELLPITDKLKDLISREPIETEIKKLAIEEGMVTLGQDGLLKILRGITTVEEVERVAGLLEWKK
ncbi:MAG: GspE/PulE family protein [Candidatus Paceibacterota bacterium]|jgi:type II secretory ATPase GspE/PulE/Tfp pilus assembly ATPase PilB-like protein